MFPDEAPSGILGSEVPGVYIVPVIVQVLTTRYPMYMYMYIYMYVCVMFHVV